LSDAATREGLDQVLERAAVGLAQMDTTGRYLQVNDRYCEMLGRTRRELLEGRMQDFVHPDDLPATLDSIVRAIETDVSLAVEHRQLRPDGSAVWVSNSVSVAGDAQGTAQYVVLVSQDVTARKATERALNRSQADLRLLLDSAADGIYCVNREGITTLCNAGFRRMLGFEREEEAIGKDLHELIPHTQPDGSPCRKEACPILKAARAGTHTHVVDELFFRRDGSSFPVEYWVRPIVREGQIQGAVCTFVDATARKQAEARQQLMNHEMAHRMKNTLAMVQAIVSQTLRNAATPRDAIGAINQRLVALGHAHTVLTRSPRGSASIMEVIEGAISVHRSQAGRIRASGPRLDLGGKAALAITLALHELCTNAVKYGALSNDTGSVAIDWAVTGGAADARFHLSWKERGGPAVAPPASKGFGSRLIAESVGADLKGQAKLVFDPAGVDWTLDAPLGAVKDPV
jgi:PAS domain S-box-containing protein